jgi:2'-5' RNA ligase
MRKKSFLPCIQSSLLPGQPTGVSRPMPDVQSTFVNAWSAFQRLESLSLADEATEHEFTRGRAQYLAFLIRIEDGPAKKYVRSAQERIAEIPGVDLYPDFYWHMTVKGAGFQVIKRTHQDDVLRSDVPRFAAQAKDLLAREPSFEVRLGALAGFPEVVFVEVHDSGRIRELNTFLSEKLSGVPRYAIDCATFLPHISIARFTSSEGLAQLKKRIASMREEKAGPSFLVRRIEFVKVWLSEATPEFQTLASYNLS